MTNLTYDDFQAYLKFRNKKTDLDKETIISKLETIKCFKNYNGIELDAPKDNHRVIVIFENNYVEVCLPIDISSKSLFCCWEQEVLNLIKCEDL